MSSLEPVGRARAGQTSGLVRQLCVARSCSCLQPLAMRLGLPLALLAEKSVEEPTRARLRGLSPAHRRRRKPLQSGLERRAANSVMCCAGRGCVWPTRILREPRLAEHDRRWTASNWHRRHALKDCLVAGHENGVACCEPGRSSVVAREIQFGEQFLARCLLREQLVAQRQQVLDPVLGCGRIQLSDPECPHARTAVLHCTGQWQPKFRS